MIHQEPKQAINVRKVSPKCCATCTYGEYTQVGSFFCVLDNGYESIYAENADYAICDVYQKDDVLFPAPSGCERA